MSYEIIRDYYRTGRDEYTVIEHFDNGGRVGLGTFRSEDVAREFIAKREQAARAPKPAAPRTCRCRYSEHDNHGRCYECGGYNRYADAGRAMRSF